MSFVSQLLEKMGVLQPAASSAKASAPSAPAPAPPHQAVAAAPPNDSVPRDSPQDDFDPETTQSSLDEPVEHTESTVVSGHDERTAIAESAPPSAPRSPRQLTLRDLLDERGLHSTSTLHTDDDAERTMAHSYAELYAQAKLVAPEHGWTIERAQQAVQQGRSQGLTPAKIRFSIEAEVLAAGASPIDIAADAAVKNEVLDAVEAKLATRVQQRDESLADQAEALMQQIQALQAARAEVLAQASADRNRFAQWCESKQRTEQAWADVIDVLAPFL